jgi:hypothetical protein
MDNNIHRIREEWHVTPEQRAREEQEALARKARLAERAHAKADKPTNGIKRPKLYTAAEISRLFEGVSADIIRAAIESGHIKWHPVGRRKKVTEKAVREYLRME